MLRVPKFWFRLGLVSLLGTAVWIGLDLREFLTRAAQPSKAGVRVLYVLLRETDMPAVQFTLASFAAGLFSRRSRRVEYHDKDSQSGKRSATPID